MSDEETQPLPAWAVNLHPPTPVDEPLRALLIAMEIARYSANYAADNPKKDDKKEKAE